MKKCGVLLVLLLATVAYGEVMTFPAPRMGDVGFDHTFHRGKLKGCSVCHGEAPGKIHKEWTQSNAHDFCVDCHTRLDQGPLRCAGCHKKKVFKPVSSAVFKAASSSKGH
ncbi:MAG TPA: cytochrome c3 family protein [Geobacteraceae bacterium]